MNPSPKTIDGAMVLCWSNAIGIPLTDACTFRRNNRVQTSFAGLAIAQYAGGSNVYLFFCDEEWKTQNDTVHDSVEEARGFAESLYPGIAARWQPIAG